MSSLSAAVTSNGRVFYIMDMAPPVSILTAPQWRLIARDAAAALGELDEAVREGIRDADAGHLIDHAEVKAKWQAKRAAQME